MDGCDELYADDASLRATSGIDASNAAADLDKREPRRRRSGGIARAYSEHPLCADDLLAVPDAQSACRRCGGGRACIGHVVTRSSS